MIEQSVAYLRAQGRRVIYDAEHFFDGYRADPSYALETLRAAVRGGAEIVVLCDTNGGIAAVAGRRRSSARCRPRSPTRSASTRTTTASCAVANTLAAVARGRGPGAGHDQRLRRALRQRQPLLDHPDARAEDGAAVPAGRAAPAACASCRTFVAEVANLAPDEHLPTWAKSAFAHKGGMHVAAMRRNDASLPAHRPDAGRQRDAAWSSASCPAAATCSARPRSTGSTLTPGARPGEACSNEIKELEARGFSFEAAEASRRADAEAAARRATGRRSS